MLAKTKTVCKNIDHLEQYLKDSRLTDISDGKVFDYHKMLELVQQLKRPLTEKEAGQFRIK